MRVLLIGGSGYVGSYMADYLKKQGQDVFIYDKLKPAIGGISFYEGDMRDLVFLSDIVSFSDVIIILAGLVGDKACEAHPNLAYVTNHRTVAQICTKFSDKHIIFLSTAAVYGASKDLLHENSPVNPLSVYASTKLAGEKHLISMEGTVFRLGSVYGVGFDKAIRLDSIINLLAKQAVTKNEIRLLGGDQWKSFISVKDVAGFVNEAINKNIRGLYNLSHINLQLIEVANKILSIFPETIIDFAERPENDRDYQIDNRKLLSKFEYRFESSLEKELIELGKLFAS